jgi:Sec-independent protein translocase protein TatA
MGNFGATEILIILGIAVVLFGVPRRRKMKRKAASHLRQTKDWIGSVKGEFLSGMRDEAQPRKDRDSERVVVLQEKAHRRSTWLRRVRGR